MPNVKELSLEMPNMKQLSLEMPNCSLVSHPLWIEPLLGS
jgi:hypothetical protein